MSQINSERPPLTTAWGAGGEYGIYFNLAVADALRPELAEAGIDLARIQHLGTSAGSWAAAALAVGRGVEHAITVPTVSIYDPAVRAEGYLQGLARQLLGDEQVDNVRTSTVRLGMLARQEILDSRDHRLGDIVAASGAVPFLFSPVEIDGERYVDGGFGSFSDFGIGSTTHADKAADADYLLVTTPMAFTGAWRYGMSMMGRMAGLMAQTERQMWSLRRHGRGGALVVPDEATTELIRKPDDLFDRHIGEAAYERTYRAVRERLSSRSDELPRMIGALAARTAAV